MAEQQKIQMNGITIKQPDKDMACGFETTYSEDSGRGMIGNAHLTPLFTVEAFTYSATDLTVAEMQQILRIVARGEKFTLHYFSPFYGKWRDAKFYVGQGNLSIGTLEADGERYESLTFNMTGVDPI